MSSKNESLWYNEEPYRVHKTNPTGFGWYEYDVEKIIDRASRLTEVFSSLYPSIKEVSTLRDQFAMAALTGICSASFKEPVSAKDVAEYAYVIAKAMMEERKKYE